MADPNWNSHHGSVDNLTALVERGAVNIHPTFASTIHGPSINPSDPFMPNMTPVNFTSESASSMSSPSAQSSSLAPSLAPTSTPSPSITLLGRTFVEVAGPFSSFTRGGQRAVFSLTTGNLSCFRDPTSLTRWFGFRSGEPQIEHFDGSLQFPHNFARAYVREVLAIHQALLNAFLTNYSGRHTALSIEAALKDVQPQVVRHLYSDAMAHSTVHILYDFPFLELHHHDGKEVMVQVLITIEYYQAPWRTVTKRWNRRGSLNTMNVAWYMTTGIKDQYNFEEVVALDPISDSRHIQPQVALAASGNVPQQPTALSATVSMNPDALMTCKDQVTAITATPLNGASQSSQANASLVSDLNIDAGDVLKTNASMVTLSRSSQKDAQTISTSDDPLAADTSTMLTQSSVISGHQMIDGHASNFKAINNSGDSILMAVTNLQDHERVVPSLNDPQPKTNSRRTRTINPRPARTTNPRPTKTTNSRLTRATNPRTTRTASPTRSVKSFSCRYLVCTHPPFTTKWSLKAHMNTHDGVYFPCPDCGNVYARYNDRYRHMRTRHKGYRWRCEHCQKGHSRKPTGEQLLGCDEDEEGNHSFQEYDLSSAPASASAVVDVL
ncbi:hypothetical protein BG015_004503 [Linnemannia schmuckeri]|uniref:C2H2-type domain-containing protein n=1 Tax=Linnemannia schmuckeri TaxID=64567 RepID=A0A9P5RCJ1_9FUNG|nr:hypothetical protein BG015_004503 [Linnemannia schmuckeri]